MERECKIYIGIIECMLMKVTRNWLIPYAFPCSKSSLQGIFAIKYNVIGLTALINSLFTVY